MPKKPDLSKAFGERFKTEEKVDVQDPIAAAIAASKETEKQDGLLEDTHVRTHARKDESEPESQNENVSTSLPERKQIRKSVSGTTRKQERIEAPDEAYIGKGVIIEVLYDQIQQKKHLSNGSFRYKADELEKLDAIYRELEDKKPGRISKNDIARMALIAFYEDYEENGDESILAQVFKRM